MLGWQEEKEGMDVANEFSDFEIEEANDVDEIEEVNYDDVEEEEAAAALDAGQWDGDDEKSTDDSEEEEEVAEMTSYSDLTSSFAASAGTSAGTTTATTKLDELASYASSVYERDFGSVEFNTMWLDSLRLGIKPRVRNFQDYMDEFHWPEAPVKVFSSNSCII